MLLRFWSITFLFLFLSCQDRPAPRGVTAPVGSAKVVDPDRIYFKNVRAVRYLAQDNHKEYYTVYTHRKLAEAEKGWQLSFTDDWINDRAWLHFSDTEAGHFYRLGAAAEEMVLLEQKQFTDIKALQNFAQRLAAPYDICYRSLASTESSCLASESPQRLALRETIADFSKLTDQD